MRRLRLDVAFDVSNGQLDCRRRKYATCHIPVDGRRTVVMRFDLEKHHRAARRTARRLRRSWLAEFVEELVDSTVHEFVHFNEPPYCRTDRSEEMAETFAKWGRRTRLRAASRKRQRAAQRR